MNFGIARYWLANPVLAGCLKSGSLTSTSQHLFVFLANPLFALE